MRVTSYAQLIAGALALPLHGAASQPLWVGARVAASTAGFATVMPSGALLGGEFGAVALVPLTHEILLEPELKVVRRGANLLADASIVERLSLAYLELPILVRWQPRFGESSFVHPVLHAGPSLSVNLACRYTLELPEASSWPCESRPWGLGRASQFGVPRRIDVAAVVGGGIAFELGRSLLTIDVRFNRGFLPVDRLDLSDAHNEAWTFGVAWGRVW